MITKEQFLDVYNAFFKDDPINIGVMNDSTLTEYVNRANKYYTDKTSHYNEDELIQQTCAILMEISEDIPNKKIANRAKQLLDEHYEDALYEACVIPM